jgi:hypothetical protein
MEHLFIRFFSARQPVSLPALRGFDHELCPESTPKHSQLRCVLWRQWKTVRRRRAAVLELGVRPQLAANMAGSGRGSWYLALTKALNVGLSKEYFRSLGLPSLCEEC